MYISIVPKNGLLGNCALEEKLVDRNVQPRSEQLRHIGLFFSTGSCFRRTYGCLLKIGNKEFINKWSWGFPLIYRK